MCKCILQNNILKHSFEAYIHTRALFYSLDKASMLHRKVGNFLSDYKQRYSIIQRSSLLTTVRTSNRPVGICVVLKTTLIKKVRVRTHAHTNTRVLYRVFARIICQYIQAIFRAVFLFVLLYGFGLRCLLVRKVTGLDGRKY